MSTRWLESNPSNRLYIYGAEATQDKGSGHHYGGMWKHYIDKIWADRSIAQQAIICDYDDMSHNAIVESFYKVIESTPSCLPAPGGFKLTQWSP